MSDLAAIIRDGIAALDGDYAREEAAEAALADLVAERDENKAALNELKLAEARIAELEAERDEWMDAYMLMSAKENAYLVAEVAALREALTNIAENGETQHYDGIQLHQIARAALAASPGGSDRECEHKWRDYSEYGGDFVETPIVCRDCGAAPGGSDK